MNTDDWLLICNIVGLVIAAIGLVFTILGHLRYSGRIVPYSQKETKPTSGKSSYYLIMSVIILLLAGVLVWQLVQNTKPVLVFAGGGSVRSFLNEEYHVDIRKQRNSINIAMASGSAWRVLAEEYQFNKTKNRKLNRFTTICLSAGEITDEFYSEYFSKLDDNTIVAKVFLGDDALVTYVSPGLLAEWNMLGAETISSEALVQRIQEKITNPVVMVGNESRKARVFTTNKTSGTLEAYKQCFQDLKKDPDSLLLDESKKVFNAIGFHDTIKTLKSIRDSIIKRDFINLEMMIDDNLVSVFYDNMDPDKIDTDPNDSNIQQEFIILGSQYYNVKDNEGKDKGKSLYLLNSKGEKIYKKLYLYFIADDGFGNQYKIKRSVLKFLKKLEQNNDTLFKSEQLKWEKEIKKKRIIKYDPKNDYDKSRPNQRRVKQIN